VPPAFLKVRVGSKFVSGEMKLLWHIMIKLSNKAYNASMTITEKVDKIIFTALAGQPDGVRWAELLRIIKETDPTIHPKTANGLVWKLVERHPDRVEKPEKGLFRLRSR